MGSTKLPWLQTYSGRVFNPLQPDKSDITIGDIAFALSNITRFTGHCPFYSVAQHSVLVSYLVDPRYQREALLHDASEAYLNDVNTPVKSLAEMAGYKDVEAELQRSINQKFGCHTEEIDEVKIADKKALRFEIIKFFPYNCPLWQKYVRDPNEYTNSKVRIGKSLPPGQSNLLFLSRYHELFEDPFCNEARLPKGMIQLNPPDDEDTGVVLPGDTE